MKSRGFNPLKLDIPVFAGSGQTLAGHWPLAQLPRLAALAVQGIDAYPSVEWQAVGEERLVNARPQIWLHIKAHMKLALTCQRCLAPVQESLDLDRWLRFVESEEQAAELDAESEDDVLVLSNRYDLRWLIEDELILAAPLVPMHQDCSLPQALSGSTAGSCDADHAPAAQPDASAGADDLRQQPFADLRALMKRPPGSDRSN